MRIDQFAYLALISPSLPAEAITAAVGLAPDRIAVRGSIRPDPPVPVSHGWFIECKEPGLRVDEQVTDVLGRIAPVAVRIRALVDDAGVRAVLAVVRRFGCEPDADDAGDSGDGDDSGDAGEPEHHDAIRTADGATLEVIPGQHQLLGWHLTAEQIAILAQVRATLDVDEYG
jgi:hypothetical protein